MARADGISVSSNPAAIRQLSNSRPAGRRDNLDRLFIRALRPSGPARAPIRAEEQAAPQIHLRGGDAEDAELEGEGGVVADQGEQLEEAIRAEVTGRLAVLGVVEVTAGGQGGSGAGDDGLAAGQRTVVAVADGGEVGVGEAGGAADGFVGVLLEVGAPVGGDDEDGDLAGAVVEGGLVADGGAEGLQGGAEARLEEEGVERALEAAAGVGQAE